MRKIIVQQETTALWHSLVTEAETQNGRFLDEELESYLVFLLYRFTNRPDIADSLFAIDYLEGKQATGSLAQEKLRETGDQCLLYAGLFPHQAAHKHVPLSYFVGLGQRAYHILSSSHGKQLKISTLYSLLAQQFIDLVDTLLVIRELGEKRPGLNLNEAMSLWENNQSQYALEMLRKASENLPGASQDFDDNLIKIH